jgi:hypothetical protein
MSLTEVLIASEDLTVLGGPESISLDLDFGPAGQRGSQIFVSNGKPNLVQIGQTPNVFDLCINTLTSDDEYLYMYQYQNISGSNTWTPLFKIIPNIYSTNRTVTFVDGEITINVPVRRIIPESLIGSITASKFNVQHSISGNSNPVSSSISISTITSSTGGDMVLPVTIKAIEYSSGIWSNLGSTATVHLLISLTDIVV